MTPLAFVDTETTHLSAEIGEVWEVAAILRKDGVDTEYLWQLAPLHLDAEVHGEALRVSRYHERYCVPRHANAAFIGTDGSVSHLSRGGAVDNLTAVLRGAVLVGSNPAFDDRHLRKLLDIQGREQPWHYRTIDIATLAAGYLYGQAERMTNRDCDAKWYAKVRQRIGWPWKSYQASEAAGIPRPDDAAAHTALGDARWARDLFDEITIPNSFYTASDEQLADMVAEAIGRRGGAS